LSSLFKKEIVVYTSLKPFSSKIGNETIDFGEGTLVIPVGEQKKNSDELYSLLSEIGKKYSLEIVPVETGFNVKGIDLGSNNVKPLEKPEILILTGKGISSGETGEAWFLIDNHLDIPVTRADISGLGSLDLKRYNTIILPSPDGRPGNELADKAAISRLKNWIGEGGTLIAINKASEWVIKNELVNEKLVPEKVDSSRTIRYDYADQVQVEGSKIIGGTILTIDVDTSHPIGFGLASRDLPILKNNALVLKYSLNAYNTVAFYGEKPWLSGYISSENQKRLSKTAAVLVSPVQSGRVVLFAFDPIHRASWFADAKLFFNAIYFGQLTGGNSGRYRASGYE
jgi:hypothetical protein